MLHGKTELGLYKLQGTLPPKLSSPAMAYLTSLEDWHARLGHPNFRTVSQLVNLFHLPCSKSKPSSNKCEACCLGKLHRVSLPLTNHRCTKPLELIHSDVWGPAPICSVSGFKYFVIFIDDYSLFTWLFPMKCKSEVASIFYKFQAMAEKQFDTKIKSFNSDWGGEYRPLHTYFQQHGIIHRITCPHTHEQNGTAERKIRHIVDIGLTLLGHCGAPYKYWEFSFETAMFLINRLPTTSLHNKIPYQVLYHKVPDFNFLRVFGCAVYPLLRPFNKHKFSYRTTQCIFLGYSPSHLGYRCLDKITGKIYVSRHVTFDEKLFPFQHLNSTSSDVLTVNLPSSPWLQVSHSLPVEHCLSHSSGMSPSFHTPTSSLPPIAQPNHLFSNISPSPSHSYHDSNVS